MVDTSTADDVPPLLVSRNKEIKEFPPVTVAAISSGPPLLIPAVFPKKKFQSFAVLEATGSDIRIASDVTRVPGFAVHVI
jgi:hypothetical protein